MSDIDVSFDFNLYPTLLKMWQDTCHFKVVIGPTGSAKSSAVAVLAFYDALRQKPSADGVRRTKTLIVRNTFAQLEANTIESWRQILGGAVRFVGGNRPSGLCKLPLPDGTAIEWKIQFLALESPNIDDDIVGLEVTNIVFEEIMKMQDMQRVLAVVSRAGRYPSMKLGGPTNVQCWGTANGPTKAHWLYDVHIGKHDKILDEMAANMGKPFLKIYQQPSGLVLKQDGTYEPNPMAENIHNLKMGYANYYQQLLRSQSEISAYVMGEFSDLVTGKLVYPQFRRGLHTIPYETFTNMWGKSGYISMTFDFGRTPVCLLMYRKRTGGIVIFEEIMAENSSIDGLYLQHIKPVLDQRYPQARIDFATGDPAGNDGTQSTDITPYGVLHKYGVPIEFPGGSRRDSLDARIEATRQRMMTLDDTGTPLLQVTDNCRMLLEALTSTYIYEQVHGKTGVFRDVPTKTHANWASDLCNAVEYACLSQAGNLTPRRKTERAKAASLFAG